MKSEARIPTSVFSGFVRRYSFATRISDFVIFPA